METTGAVKRSIRESVEKLTEAGHELVRVELSDNFQRDCQDLWLQLMSGFTLSITPYLFH